MSPSTVHAAGSEAIFENTTKKGPKGRYRSCLCSEGVSAWCYGDGRIGRHLPDDAVVHRSPIRDHIRQH